MMRRFPAFLGSDSRAFYTLLGICVLLRVGLWLTVREPHIYLDSEDYLELADQIQRLDFTDYKGQRPPLYALLLVLFRFNYPLIFIFQNLVGIALSLLLFRLTLQRTHNPPLSFLVGLFSSLTLYKLYYESVVMTETLAAFLLGAAVYGLWAVLFQNRRRHRDFLLLGLVTALAGFNRPHLLFLTPLFGLIVFFFRRPKISKALLQKGLVFLTPFLIGWFGLSYFNLRTVDHFGPTTLTGFNLTNHSGAYMEYASPRYAALRDIYLKYREIAIQEAGTHYCAIYDAEAEMRATLGLTMGGLCRELTALSLDLFIKHPWLYAKSVAQAFYSFWDVEKKGHWQPVKNALPVLVTGLEYFGRLVNITFFILCFLLFISTIRRDRKTAEFSFELLVAGIILIGATLQALVECGDNRRYAIPFHPLIWYVILIAGWQYLSRWWRRLKLNHP